VSAGLPGLGLGGLFFIISALLAPFRQLWLTLRGRSRPGQWRVVGRQFAQALTMVIAIDLTLRLTYGALSLAGLGDPPSGASATVLPLTLIGITSALLLFVLVAAKLAELRVRIAGGGPVRISQVLPRQHPARALAYGALVAVAWVALLSVGAAELSPLSRPAPKVTTAQRPEPEPESNPPHSAASPQRDARQEPRTTTAGGADAVSPGAGAEGGGALQGQQSDGGTAGAQSPPPQPSVSEPTSAPTGPSGKGGSVGGGTPQTPAAAPQGAPAQPPAVQSPSGPPPTAGPPEGSPAPESAGPPETSSAPEHAGPPEGSPAPEHAGPGKP